MSALMLKMALQKRAIDSSAATADSDRVCIAGLRIRQACLREIRANVANI